MPVFLMMIIRQHNSNLNHCLLIPSIFQFSSVTRVCVHQTINPHISLSLHTYYLPILLFICLPI